MSLDGTWAVWRTGGLLPPLAGVRKTISGDRGQTRLGPLPGLPFAVRDRALHYRGPFSGFVDVLEPAGEGGGVLQGRATFRGRTFGRFTMRRI